MTAALLRPDSDRAPTSMRVFRSVTAVTVLVTLISVAVPSSDMVSVTVAVVVVALLGIPHGAVDHLVAAPSRSPATSPATSPASGAPGTVATTIGPVRFHVGYVGAMVAYGLVWLVVPAIALAGFLVLSVHHFGQSDLAHLRIERGPQSAIQTSRGLLVVGVPLVAHLSEVAPVIERLGGVDPTSWTWLAGYTALWCTLLVGQHVAVGVFVAPYVHDRATRVREVVTVGALTALLLVTDPLIGFAVYFGLWHSLNHLHVLATVLGRRSGSAAMRPSEFARRAAPRSVMSVGALAALVTGALVVDRPEMIVPVTLVFVSMLTVPHMVVVERLWRIEPSLTAAAGMVGGDDRLHST